MSRVYARGRKAWGIDQRTGFRHLLKDLITDGRYPGLMVTRESYEDQHPQEIPVSVDDPVALEHPSPEVTQFGTTVTGTITDGFATALALGDYVKLAGDGVTVETATASTALGTFDGCQYNNLQGEPVWSPTWAASTATQYAAGATAYIVTEAISQ